MRNLSFTFLIFVGLGSQSAFAGIQMPKGGQVATVKKVLPQLVQVEFKDSKGKTQKRWLSSNGFEKEKILTGSTKLTMYVDDLKKTTPKKSLKK